MSTYETDNTIPAEIAKRLCVRFASNPLGPLAILLHNGSTPPVARNFLKSIREDMEQSAAGKSLMFKDSHAFEANFRALYGYFEEHEDRGYTREWDFIKSYGEVAGQTIPWSYRSGWDPSISPWWLAKEALNG